MNTVEGCNSIILHALNTLEEMGNVDVKGIRVDYMTDVIGRTFGKRNEPVYYRELGRMNIIVRLNILLEQNSLKQINIKGISTVPSRDKCENCETLLEITDTGFVCPTCNLIKDNIIPAPIQPATNGGKKHYENKMDIIFGRTKKDPSQTVITKVKDFINKKHIKFDNESNYAYRMRNILKTLKIKNHNTHITKLIKVCAGKEIPTLTYHEEHRHQYLFNLMDRSQTILQLGKYKLGYDFIIRTVFRCGFEWDEKCQEICKFIFIQDTDRFAERDERLEKIIQQTNENVGTHVLTFHRTPMNIYATYR